jgi:hypothetical protein
LDLTKSKSNDYKTRTLLEHNKIENIEMCLQRDIMNLTWDPLSFNGHIFQPKVIQLLKIEIQFDERILCSHLIKPLKMLGDHNNKKH